ncbi:MAG: hypothetical protein QXX20_08030 [Candidatus Thermoplasmatota archaeon]
MEYPNGEKTVDAHKKRQTKETIKPTDKRGCGNSSFFSNLIIEP